MSLAIFLMIHMNLFLMWKWSFPFSIIDLIGCTRVAFSVGWGKRKSQKRNPPPPSHDHILHNSYAWVKKRKQGKLVQNICSYVWVEWAKTPLVNLYTYRIYNGQYGWLGGGEFVALLLSTTTERWGDHKCIRLGDHKCNRVGRHGPHRSPPFLFKKLKTKSNKIGHMPQVPQKINMRHDAQILIHMHSATWQDGCKVVGILIVCTSATCQDGFKLVYMQWKTRWWTTNLNKRQPITLLTVIYVICAKTLHLRLQPTLIDVICPKHIEFLPLMFIYDNIDPRDSPLGF